MSKRQHHTHRPASNAAEGEEAKSTTQHPFQTDQLQSLILRAIHKQMRKSIQQEIANYNSSQLCPNASIMFVYLPPTPQKAKQVKSTTQPSFQTDQLQSVISRAMRKQMHESTQHKSANYSQI